MFVIFLVLQEASVTAVLDAVCFVQGAIKKVAP